MLGEYLKKCREASGLNLEAISKKTRIRPDHLQELEAEDFKRFAGSVYVKSYVKQYLEALSIDPSEGLSIYDRMLEKSDGVKQPDADTPATQTTSPAKIIYPVVILVALAAVVIYSLSGGRIRREFDRLYDLLHIAGYYRGLLLRAIEDTPAQEGKPPAVVQGDAWTAGQTTPSPQPSKPPEAVSPPVLLTEKTPDAVQAAVALPAQKTADADKPAIAGEVLNPGAPKLSQDTTPKLTQEATLKPDSASPASSAPKPADESRQAGKYMLSIKAVEETWISARLDHKENHTRLLYPGDSVVLSADEFIYIRIGNAGGITATLNNKDLGRLGESSQVVTLMFPKNEIKTAPRSEPATAPKSD